MQTMPLRHSTFNSDRSENVAYNYPTFPAYLREGLLSQFPSYSADSHWHEDLEFIVILRGEMTYNVNGTLVEIPEGGGIFVNSRHLHYGFSEARHECDFLCILLDPALLGVDETLYRECVEPFLRNPALPYMLLEPRVDWQRTVLDVLTAMYAERDVDFAPFVIQSRFFTVFRLLYENCPRPADNAAQKAGIRESRELETLKKMMLYVQESYQSTVSLDGIAAAGGACKSKCSALFKKYLRDSPITYVVKYRLKKSRALLAETDRAVTDIALECGFNGASYFCETFRQYYGVSPSEYRSGRCGAKE